MVMLVKRMRNESKSGADAVRGGRSFCNCGALSPSEKQRRNIIANIAARSNFLVMRESFPGFWNANLLYVGFRFRPMRADGRSQSNVCGYCMHIFDARARRQKKTLKQWKV